LAAIARDATPTLENLATSLIAHGQQTGDIPETIATAAEGPFLLAATEGLQGSIQLGQLAPDQALALIDHQLDRIFTTSP
jgi:hypothetical protein